jgi:L-asparagine transporter-like permease
MVTYLPISSPFIRFASRYMDEAIGFAAGWNFFVFEAILVRICDSFYTRTNLIFSLGPFRGHRLQRRHPLLE